MTLILETSAGRTTLETLRERYEREPGSKLFMPLADQLRMRGEYGEAIGLCMRGKDLYPRYVSCRVLLGRCLMELGMREEARRELEEVLELDRENVVSLRVMAEILRAQGRLEEATDYYRAALRINPVDMDAQERLAALMRLRESPVESEPIHLEQMEDERFDATEETCTETIELDAWALSAKWDSFSPDGVSSEEHSIAGVFEPVEPSMSHDEPVAAAVPVTDEKPPVREAVQFFNYDVERSDFSRFTDWIRAIQQEDLKKKESEEAKEPVPRGE